MNNHLKNEDYKNLLAELRGIIDKSKQQAYRAVDNIKVQTYWQIGERIVREELNYKDRAEYGKYLINNLVIDLDIEKRMMYRIIRFYKAYPIMVSLIPQLSWTHYYWLINLDDKEERRFYEQKIIFNSWSVRELRNQIKNRLYQNTDQKEILTISKNITSKVIDIHRELKPEYDLSFLDLEDNYLEKDLEDKIVSDIGNFLKELGPDFMFLEQQMPILIANEKHFIDLVLFHRGIPCVVLIDLKIGKFDSNYIGQMNKYVNYFCYNKQYAHEQDAIGLIICKDADSEEVFYALGGLEDKIFVAKYKTKLPSEEQIKKIIQKIKNPINLDF